MTREEIQRLYSVRMQNIIDKNARRDQEQADADRAAMLKTQEAYAKASAGLSVLNMYKDLKENHEMGMLDATYGGAGDITATGQPLKFTKKDPRSIGEVLDPRNISETAKRLLPGGQYEETEGYKQFKADKVKAAEELQLKQKQENLKLVQQGILTEEEVIEMENKGFRFNPETEQFEPITEMDPAELEKARAELEELRQKRAAWPKTEEAISGEEISKTIVPITGDPIAVPGEISPTDFTVGIEEPVDMDTGVTIEGVDVGLEEGKTGAQAAIDQAMEAARLRLQETEKPGLVGKVQRFLPGGETGMETTEDVLDRMMMEGWEAGGKQKGKVDTSQMLVSAGALTDAPLDVSGEKPSLGEDVFKTGGKWAGKAFQGAQTLQDITSIGNILTDENASDQDKTLAGTRGVKMLADLATKKAGQKTVSEIGTAAASKFFAKGGLEKGAKLGAKQTLGAVAGGVMGAHTMVTEAGEAQESWKEGDYDEAILQGIGAVSGGLQTAGAGMLATGIGAPIGAILYGVGTAGAMISNVGQFIEGLFGGDEPKKEKPKQKFNAGHYLRAIGRPKRYAY